MDTVMRVTAKLKVLMATPDFMIQNITLQMYKDDIASNSRQYDW